MDTLRSGTVEVHVPAYPRLQAIKSKQAELQTLISRLQQEAARVEAEAQRLGQQSESNSIGDLEAYSQRRAQLKREFDSLEYQAAGHEAALRRLDEEYGSWLNNFATWLYKKDQLVKELGSAPDTDEPLYDAILDRETPRSRAQIKYELQNLTMRLAAFSGDPTLLTEMKTLEAQ
jgi:chromosome segregation ATPase